MSGPAQSYLEKWRQRCPELRLLEVFHRGAEGARQLAWACMLAEWEEAMFSAGDPAVGRTKLLWWCEDLARGRDAAQHPLSRHLLELLESRPVEAESWRQLGAAALQLQQTDRAGDPDCATQQERWQPFAGSLAALEQAALGHPVDAVTLAAQLRFDRLLVQLARDGGEVSMLPRDFRSRFGGQEYWRGQGSAAGWTALAIAWATPDGESGSAWRRLRLRLQQRCWVRLRRGEGVQRAGELGSAALLWHSWRAAQRAGAQATPHSHVRS